MDQVLIELKAEMDSSLSECFITKPLDRAFHFKFKEIAINYEISLELKSQ